ncbi:MAG: hypothetical protein H6747_13455 [Deltaproteobacteria bacterium]|nr:hypothetical protein [Deltaproteobacteria bacterium]
MAEHISDKPHAVPFERSLAGLVERVGADVDAWDRDFAFRLALTLAEVRGRLWIAPLEWLGLRDVTLTLQLDEVLSVVVTGHVPGIAGGLTWRFTESEMRDVEVEIRAEEQPFSLSICALDGSCRGRRARLLQRAGPIPEGQVVRLRARVSIDGEESYRVEGLGLAGSVVPGGLVLLDDTEGG